MKGLFHLVQGSGIGALYEVHRQIGGTPNLNWFFGGGAYIGFQYDLVYTGPTGIVGMDYKFDNAPINLSLTGNRN
jgi:hypothetical protein